jgi:hypothetical protein
VLAEEEQRVSEARQKELAARKAKALLDLPGLREALKSAEAEQARTDHQMQEANKAAAEAKTKASQDVAAYTAASVALDRTVGEGKQKDAARKTHMDAKQQAIETKLRAEGLDTAAKQAKTKVEQGAVAVDKAATAVQQAESDLR